MMQAWREAMAQILIIAIGVYIGGALTAVLPTWPDRVVTVVVLVAIGLLASYCVMRLRHPR